MSQSLPMIGFIGLGAMGGAIVRNLLAAGYPVRGFDLNAERQAACVAAGMSAGSSVVDVVQQCAVIMTSLPSSQAFITVAEEELLPNVRAGQLVIDFGTTLVPKTRELADRFAATGVDFIDAPLSGGPGGVARKQLYIFLGGPTELINRWRPLFQVVGGSERITHCGPVGTGQIVKGVNQLMMGLGNAAYLEAIAFGVNAGVDAEVIQQALGNSGRWRVDLHATAGQVAQEEGADVGVKFRELPYFLEAAAALGFSLPLTEHLYTFCDAGERVVIDDNRPAPSFWHELTKDG
ncbi:MAG: NAD(P)-dependent oxidoreductase [Caldilineaceae bacterium]